MIRAPKFLILLCFTEMWERFSFYGMRALLVLFLTTQFGLPDTQTFAIFSLYAALCFAGPPLAGIIADKLVGFRNMVILGGTIIIIGHITMALIPFNDLLLYLGLGFVAVGTGLFKGNISNLLGSCYDSDDPRRDTGFTWFHISVNTGSALAVTSCAYVAHVYGWHYGFGLAAIGMILGLITFITYQKILGEHGLARPEMRKKTIANLPLPMFIFVGSIIAAIMCSFMLYNSLLFGKLLAIFCGVMFLYLGYVTSKLTPVQRNNIILLVVLITFFMLFFALEMQLGSLFNLFTARNVDKHILGFNIPAAISQAINPSSVIIAGPLLAMIFYRLGYNWSIRRIGIGIATMAGCFGILYIGCLNANADNMVSYSYLVAAIFLMAIGELCIVPVIYNLCTTLTPIDMRGFMMGMLMLSVSLSNLSGNIIAKFMSISTVGAKELDTAASLVVYQNGFLKIMYFNIYVLIAFSILYPLLNRATKKNVERGMELATS